MPEGEQAVGDEASHHVLGDTEEGLELGEGLARQRLDVRHAQCPRRHRPAARRPARRPRRRCAGTPPPAPAPTGRPPSRSSAGCARARTSRRGAGAQRGEERRHAEVIEAQHVGQGGRVGEPEVVGRQPIGRGQRAVHAVEQVDHAAQRAGELRRLDAVRQHAAPRGALARIGNAGDGRLALGLGLLQDHGARADGEGDRRGGGMHLLVEQFGPQAHRVTGGGRGRPQRHVGERVVEVLVDQRRLDEHGAVVHHGRHDVVGVELDVGRVVLRAAEDVDLVRDEIELLLGEHEPNLLRAGGECESGRARASRISFRPPATLRRPVGQMGGTRGTFVNGSDRPHDLSSSSTGSATSPGLRQATKRSGRTSRQPSSATSRRRVQAPSTSLLVCPRPTVTGSIVTPVSRLTCAAASRQSSPSMPVISVKRS